MPLGHEVFPGNRTDVTTVEEIVEAMEARYGLASEDNLDWSARVPGQVRDPTGTSKMAMAISQKRGAPLSNRTDRMESGTAAGVGRSVSTLPPTPVTYIAPKSCPGVAVRAITATS